MTFKWDATISLGSVIVLVVFVASAVGAYYATEMRTQSRFADLIQRFDKRFAETMQLVDGKFSDINLQLTRMLDGDVRELRGKIGDLESGQSEWTKTIRDRTHALANDMQTVLLRLDRLERPGSGKRRRSASA